MLEIDGVTKCFGAVRALDGLDLRVVPGEIAGLIGHNGAGKSTLVAVVSGLLPPDSGRALVCGLDPARQPRAARRQLGVAPQEEALYPELTVREHLRLFAALGGLRRRAAFRAVETAAEEMALTGFLDRRVGVLSGGQRRRTQTATALVHSPPVLLLDEPTVGADPETRRALLAAVRARADAGAAVLYTTHYLPELTELGATVAVIESGRLTARGTRRELLSGLPGRLRLTLTRPIHPADLATIRAAAEDRAIVTADGEQIEITAREPGQLLGRLVALTIHDGHSLAGLLREVEVEDASLDQLSARGAETGISDAA